jgi:cysteinyl-tRNA synthetase
VKIPDDVKQLADQRLEAKQAKDYTRADEIRKEILDM